MASIQRQVLAYTLLPGFWPRIKGVFAVGFSHVAYLLAVIYASVGLLPRDHDYLNPVNIGKYGLRHVIAAAASNLVFTRNNIDQIVVFTLILTGLVLLFLQFVLLIAAFIFQPAMAQSFSEVFGVNPLPAYEGGAQDIVFIIMDRIFGMVGIFESCISLPAVDCVDQRGNEIALTDGAYPYPMHQAFHTLLEFYSRGIFVISVFVILYFITTIVAETAVTGSPFGQRFNKLWAPIRLILFFGLLMPINIGSQDGGTNSAQVLTLWIAKFGSNFATNTWLLFNDTLTGTYLGETRNLVAKPNIPELSDLLQFMYVAKTCKIGMEMAYPSLIGGKIQAYIVRERQFPVARVPGADAREFLPIGFDAAAAFSNFGNISIVFGHLDTERNKDFKAGVRPYCGSINVNVGQIDDPGAASSGVNAIQALYFQLIKEMWQNSVITDQAECTVRRVVQEGLDPNCPHRPDTDFASSQVQLYQTYLKNNLGPLIDRQIANTDWSVQDPILRLGWAGSSVWYNRIADINGEVTTAVLNIPQGSRFPELMELVAEKKKMQNENINPATLYNPILGDGQPLDLQNAVDLQVATAMYSAYSFWSKDEIAATHFTSRDSNIVVSFINKVFGTSGIYDMLENQSIHPMAQLSSLGRAMTEASIRNIFFGGVGNFAFNGKVLDEKTLSAVSSLLNAIGFAFLGIGLILYYILPLLPFIYFIFAVSGWVKGVFEAIIAMPLWALAHILRIDGRGLPGPAATSGYFLLLEIFLRPTLIVIGMIASISIFSSMVVMLNDVFQIAVVNLGGFNRENPTATMLDNFRGPIDQFFYTIMYVIAVYMLALSSFKLIDQIPNTIMRWMNAGVSSFQEKNKNAADELVGRADSAYKLASGQIRGGNLALLLK